MRFKWKIVHHKDMVRTSESINRTHLYKICVPLNRNPKLKIANPSFLWTSDRLASTKS